MAKYIEADRLKEEFQKRFDICKRVSEDDRNALDTQDWYRGKYTAYSECLSFIDSLSEEPDKSLEEAAEEVYPIDISGYSVECRAGATPEPLDYHENERRAFIAGAEWQKTQMMKDAVEGYVGYYEDSGGRLMAEAQVGCPYHVGDKVRIIVLKAEEK